MSPRRFDIRPFLASEEGQYFDRKSLYEGPDDAKRARNRKVVRDQVAEYVAAFANADGGVLVLGLEDNGAVTGHSLPADALKSLLEAPQTRLEPPQEPGFVVEHEGHALVVFDVAASDVPVQVTGDGFPLRMGDKTVQTSESKIRAMKLRGMAESYEAEPSALTLADLDGAAIARARFGAGYEALGDEAYLVLRKLADRRGSRVVLRRAAELLFAAAGPDHPNAAVRIFRVVGRERQVGASHNVEEVRPRVEGNLVAVLGQAMAQLRPLIRRPSRLFGARFQPVSEYPDFCWMEAVLNAVAHRDYGVQGQSIEVWLFDDRMEVSSPGGLVPEVSLEELVQRQAVHASRNPRIVRALVDLGYMRDQGEGIPRIHEQMDAQFLPAPELQVRGNRFVLTLRNSPTLTKNDEDFLASLGGLDIDPVELRALLEVQRHGRVDNATLRRIGGFDTLQASAVLRRLRDRGLLELHGAGAASYYESPRPDKGNRREDGEEVTADWGEARFGRDELPKELEDVLQSVGKRPRKEKVRNAVLRLCELQPWSAQDLSGFVGMRTEKLVERHLGPMVKDGLLALRYPETPTHPQQAYRARQGSLAGQPGEAVQSEDEA